MAASTDDLDTITGAGDPQMGIVVQPLRQMIAGDIRLPPLILLGAVGFVLLIACANITNLLMACSAACEREIAIRAALGAGPTRLVRKMFHLDQWEFFKENAEVFVLLKYTHLT
jgi:hypothetical protein